MLWCSIMFMTRFVSTRQSSGHLITYFFLAILAPVYLMRIIPPAQWSQGVIPGDCRLNLWAMTWQWNTLFSNPMALWNGNAFYPFIRTITGSDHLFTEMLTGLPVYTLTGNPFLSYHFVLFAGYAIGAWGMFRLGMALFRRTTPAVAAALFFTVALPRSVHATAHIQLAHMAWMPWSAFFLHRLFRQTRASAVIGLVLTSVLQILSGWYLAVYHALAMAILLGTLLLKHRRREPFFLAIAAGMIVLGLVLPFALPYFGRPDIPPDIWTGYSARLQDFLIPASYSVYSTGADAAIMWSETTVWMGYIVPAMILITLFFRGKPDRMGRQPEISGYLLIAAAGVLLACGDNLPGLPLEYSPWTFFARLPAVGGMRVPARAVLMTVFGMSLLFGRAIWVICHKLDWRRSGEMIGAVVMIVMMIENFPTAGVVPAKVQMPEAYNWLERLPDTVPIAEVPSFYGTDLWAFSADYMMYAALHRHPVANGYSRYVPAGFPNISKTINALPHPEAIRTLRNLGIEFVIVHPQMCFKDAMLKHFREMGTRQDPIESFNDVVELSNTHYRSMFSPEGLALEISFMESPYLDLVDRFGRDLVFYLKDIQIVDVYGAHPNEVPSM